LYFRLITKQRDHPVAGLKFIFYSYAENLFWKLAEFLPPIIRTWWLRLFFKKLGAEPMIDYGVYIRYMFKVSIGDRVSINRGCRFYSSYQIKDAEIVIGDHVVLSPDVRLLGAGHDYETVELRDTASTINIGSHAWIGAGAIVLPGVTIGEGAVIGAGAVVSKDIPAWTVAAGVPAQVIRNRKVRPASA
jgi:acetyltransferase-like isoleucine patch superfamily enzyme